MKSVKNLSFFWRVFSTWISIHVMQQTILLVSNYHDSKVKFVAIFVDRQELLGLAYVFDSDH
jgi:hypothetical protein